MASSEFYPCNPKYYAPLYVIYFHHGGASFMSPLMDTMLCSVPAYGQARLICMEISQATSTPASSTSTKI